jgi:3-oxoacyl-[acyl-carrier protein] reductase
MNLENKTILITGSSRGIGAETARLAKKYGANVILHGKSESYPLKSLAKELNSKYIFCDVGNEKAVYEKIKEVGPIDVLVNNAGINPSKTFMDLAIDDWKDIFDTNVFGVVNFSKAIIPSMLERKQGKIINITSVKGYNYVEGKPAYAAAKAGVMRMTTSMAEEFAPYININSVAPGFTQTEMTAASMSPKIQSQIDSIPMKRMAKPEEIADAILFLASEKADYITGQTLAVDGGFSIISG